MKGAQPRLQPFAERRSSGTSTLPAPRCQCSGAEHRVFPKLLDDSSLGQKAINICELLMRPSVRGISANLGFLGPWPFGGENPHTSLLDLLGFPWILSSESRLISGLHRIFAEIFFAAFPRR